MSDSQPSQPHSNGDVSTHLTDSTTSSAASPPSKNTAATMAKDDNTEPTSTQPPSDSSSSHPPPSTSPTNHHPDYAKEPSAPLSKPSSDPSPPPPSSTSTATNPLQSFFSELSEIDKEQAQWRERRKSAILRFAWLHWRGKASASATHDRLATLASSLTSLSSTLIHLESEATQLSSLYSQLQSRVDGVSCPPADSSGKAELSLSLRTRIRSLSGDKASLLSLRGRVQRMQDSVTQRSVQSTQSTSPSHHKSSFVIEDITAEEEEKERVVFEAHRSTELYTREDVSASLHVASEHKAEGNAEFHKSNFSSAFGEYKQALATIHHLSYPQVQAQFPDLAEQLKQLLVSIHSNMAACKLLQKAFDDVILHTNLVLELDPHNVKGLVRRGKAYAAKGETALALIDLLRARELMKDDEKGKREIEPFVHELQRRAYEAVEKERREKARSEDDRREKERAQEREREKLKQVKFAEAFQQALKAQAAAEEEEKRQDREDEERDRRARELKVRFAPQPDASRTRATDPPKTAPAAPPKTAAAARAAPTSSSPRTAPVTNASNTPAPAAAGPSTAASTAGRAPVPSDVDQSERDAVNTLLSQLFGVPVASASSRSSPTGVSGGEEDGGSADRQLAQVATLERQVSEAKQREQLSAKQRMAALESEIRRERERQSKLRQQLQQQQRHEQAQQHAHAAHAAQAAAQQQHKAQTQPRTASRARAPPRQVPFVEFPDEEQHELVLDTTSHARQRQQPQQAGREDADDLIDSIFSHLLGVPVTTQRMSPPAASSQPSYLPLSRSPSPASTRQRLPSSQQARLAAPRQSPPPSLLYASSSHDAEHPLTFHPGHYHQREEIDHMRDPHPHHPAALYHPQDSTTVSLHHIEQQPVRMDAHNRLSHPSHPFHPPVSSSSTGHSIPIIPYASGPVTPPAVIPIDTYDRPTSYHIHAHLPGVRPTDVSLTFTSPSTLRITARRRALFDDRGGEEGGEQRMVREVAVPDDVEREGMEAKLEDGMLRVVMRKGAGRRGTVAHEATMRGGRMGGGRIEMEEDQEGGWGEREQMMARQRRG